MDEDWYASALTAFGLERAAVLEVEPNRVHLGLGAVSGCLWRLPNLPQAEGALLLAWEDHLRTEGILAARLMARDGRLFFPLDERNQAILMAWRGADLPSIRTAEELARLARFLGRFRRLCTRTGLKTPAAFGPGWDETWHTRAKRLQLFSQLATKRLNPTQFDLIYLDQADYYCRQADRAAGELAASLPGLEPGASLNRIDRHRLYQDASGLSLKILFGLAAEPPIRDLYRLLARTMPRFEWSATAAAAILGAYHGEWPLAEGDLRALQAGLRFPYDHYRLSHHYFFNHKSWPLRTYLRKQDRNWRLEPDRNRLVEELPLLLP